jgi:ribosomal protein S18 acetylase RimI-like enzyme
VTEYRAFRNGDPPGLVRIWNQCFTGRGAAALRGSTLIEYCLFAKPYFDPRGLVVAADGAAPVGFALAGFGPSADERSTDPRTGVLCAIAVLPDYRRKGVGSELLHRAEAYLREVGAATLRAGPRRPANPFTFALYGGADSPGFLDSDPAARPFLEKHGYVPRETTLVLHRSLAEPVTVGDARFLSLRQNCEIHPRQLPHSSWWRECVLGPAADLAVEYRLVDRSGQAVARAVLWEMETFRRQPGDHAVGVLELEVVPEQRRRGAAKFLAVQILRHLQEQYFSLVEAQLPEGNDAALSLARLIGFRQVDVGRCYERK